MFLKDPELMEQSKSHLVQGELCQGTGKAHLAQLTSSPSLSCGYFRVGLWAGHQEQSPAHVDSNKNVLSFFKLLYRYVVCIGAEF